MQCRATTVYQYAILFAVFVWEFFLEGGGETFVAKKVSPQSFKNITLYAVQLQ